MRESIDVSFAAEVGITDCDNCDEVEVKVEVDEEGM